MDITLGKVKSLEKSKHLNILNISNLFVLTKKDFEFDFQNKYISLSLMPKNYSEDIFSFYVFRIFYLKEKEILFYPADSDFENTCLPEKEKDKYYCNIIFGNTFNEINNDFSITGEKQNEYFKVYVNVIHKNNSLIDSKYYDFKYIYMNGKNNTSFNIYNDVYNNSEISHFIFRFEFNEGGIKNIISSFSYKSNEHFPQIYSSRMYFLYDRDLYFNYSLINNYKLVYQWLSGYIGNINLNLIGFENNIYSTRNFRGKPMVIPVTNEHKYMIFEVSKTEFIFYFKLNYNMRNKGMEEIISGEARSEIINHANFPLFYYLNLRKKEDIKVDINIRINSYSFFEFKNNFEIKGYIVEKDVINKKRKDELIVLKEEEGVIGTYCEWFGLGLLQLNKKSIKDNEYLLISISNKGKSIINSSYVILEIVNKEYFGNYDDYFMPINQYMIETFQINENKTRAYNKYYIVVNDKYRYDYKNDSEVLIEFSPNFQDMRLNLDNNTNYKYIPSIEEGSQKFRLTDIKDGPIHFNVTNPKNRTKGNYILRYYYTENQFEYLYSFDKNFEYKLENSNSDNVSFSLTFNNINVSQYYEPFNPIIKKYNITFYIYAFLYPINTSSEELVNTSSLIYNRKYIYQNKTKSICYFDKNIYLYFNNVSREHNFIYDLTLKINAFIDYNILNEEFLVYTINLNLTGIGKKPESMSKLTIILIIMGCIAIIIILVIVSFLIYIKLKNNNNNSLEKRVISFDYDEEKDEKDEKKVLI